MEEIIGAGANFFLKCFKHQTPDEVPYMNPEEFLKRLAAASGIDTLGLIKSDDFH